MFESNSLRNISGSRFWCHTNLPITLKTAQAALFQLMLIHAKRSKDSLLFPGLNKTINIHFQFSHMVYFSESYARRGQKDKSFH